MRVVAEIRHCVKTKTVTLSRFADCDLTAFSGETPKIQLHTRKHTNSEL